MPQWTPGPWKVKPFIKPPAWGIYGIASESHLRICEVEERHAPSQAPAHADALLIAAAPDLYEALEQMFHLLMNASYPPGAEYVHAACKPDQFNSALSITRAALAKARGESPDAR